MSGKKNKARLKTKTANRKLPDSKKSQTASHSSARMNFLREHWRQVSIIGLLALGLYIQSVKYDYVLDDSILIQNNKFTQRGVQGIGDIFRYESFRGRFGEDKMLVEGGRYRPLSIATFALEQSITGGNKAISHCINVLLYSLSCILIYRVLLFMFPKPKEAHIKQRWYFTVPFVAAILFAIHPLHVEVVANIKGRDEILALLGEAGALYFTFKYLGEKKLNYLFFSFLFFFAGILSKEGVITFLAVIPLTVHFFSRTGLKDKIKITIPLLIGTVFYLLMRFSALGYILNSGVEVTNLMNNPFYGMTINERMATVFYTLLLYLKLLIYPHPLTHDYYPYHIPIMHWNDWRSILSLLVHIGMLVVMFAGWKKKTVWAYSIAFYLITLSIVSNVFISVGTFMNERFAYHASLGFCIVAAWVLVEKMKSTYILKLTALLVFFASSIAFSTLTLIRLPDWKDAKALNLAAIRVSPGSARSNNFWGVWLWTNNYQKLPAGTDSSRRRAVLDSIKPWFDKALSIVPNYGAAYTMKAGMAAEYHKLDNDYEKLTRAFEEVNLSGTYEKFIAEYLQYVNKRVSNLKDAKILAAFYDRMIEYYDHRYKYKNTTLSATYKSLHREIQQRIALLK